MLVSALRVLAGFENFHFTYTNIHTHIRTQLECDRLGASDCDAPEVNAAAVLLMKYVLTLEVRACGLQLCTFVHVYKCMHKQHPRGSFFLLALG